MTPRVVPAVPAAEYHAHPALSSHGAMRLLRSPAHYLAAQQTPREPTAAQAFGTAVHAGVLEPATFDQAVARAPDVDKRTKDGKAAWQEFQAAHADAVILSADDYDRARRAIDAVNAHPAAAALLAGAQTETSLFWHDAQYGIDRKARLDLWSQNIVGDLKTCADASPDAFARSAAQWLYHVQGSWYFDAAEECFDRTPDAFVFICVESEAPHAVAVYALPSAALLAGQRLCGVAMERYAAAQKSGQWPGYPETISTLKFPAWALRFDI